MSSVTINTFQHKFDCANPSSLSWDISKENFYQTVSNDIYDQPVIVVMVISLPLISVLIKKIRNKR